ncbi:MAG TPA: cbb3-type cytochrome c oxidase subunit I, partial [Gemmatimonadales bacterium]|nr:cbb3-type cytochrome c oxidase subunit I [Gemmatimonadales bacterium]
PACLIMLGSFFAPDGAAGSGWTAYPPLSALSEAAPGSGLGQTLWILAMALWIASFTMGGLNFITTILNLRTRGMSMRRMPLTVWTLFIASILGVLCFPALTAAAIMLLLDRVGATSFFLPSGLVVGGQLLSYRGGGGSPLLFQHLFWFLGHPEVYVLVLPALGIIFDVVAVGGRRPVFGYRTSIGALIVVAVLSMIVWGHHMFVSGMSPYVGEYFSVATVTITAPFAVLAMNLVASLWRAEIRLNTALLFALALIAAVGIGGIGGIFLATATSDIYLHNSYFVVGHFHLMIAVVTFFAIFAGTYHWFPKMFGRQMNETLGRLHFWLTVPAVIVGFVAMHLLGMGGEQRHLYDPTVYQFLRPIQWLNVFISIVLALAAAAQFIFLGNLFYSLVRGPVAASNPWAATTLEWSTPSPAPHGNWPGELPVAYRGPYEYRVDDSPEGYTPQHLPPSPAPGAVPVPV